MKPQLPGTDVFSSTASDGRAQRAGGRRPGWGRSRAGFAWIFGARAWARWLLSGARMLERIPSRRPYRVAAALFAVTVVAFAATACRSKERLYCATPEQPTVPMGEQWKSVPLPIPAGARVCESSATRLTVAGTGSGPDVDAVINGFRQQGYVVDEDEERAPRSQRGMFSSAFRKGLYGLDVTLHTSTDDRLYAVSAERFIPFDAYLKQEQGTLLESAIKHLIQESANEDTDFWRDVRLVFVAEKLPLKGGYARADAVGKAYEDELREPKDLLAALDEARARGLTQVRKIELTKSDDPRLSPLQALAMDALAVTTLAVAELRPDGAKENVPAAMVLGTFAYVDGPPHGWTYLGGLEAFKDGAVVASDRQPRGKAKRGP